jgi:MoxR-like ATPase
MDRFDIIQSLCRIGLGAGNPAFRRQVERLRDALKADGQTRQAGSLTQLLRADNHTTALKPSRIVLSGDHFPGEVLTQKVSVPVDRETSAPLAQIAFPTGSDSPFPVLPKSLNTAVESLMAEWSHADDLAQVGVLPARSCLFFGLPGTGKTRLAYAIAASLGLPLVVAKLDGLVSSFLGTTARNIANLFDFANRYRCILLLDEFDALAKVRDDPQEVGEIKRVVNTVLQNLDARPRGLTIAITNHPDLLDTAVWRRFEVRIEVPPPTSSDRADIFSRYLPPLDFDDSTLRLLSWATEGLTGSDIEVLARNIKRYSVLRPSERLDYLEALQGYVLTQAGKGDETRRALILGRPQELARALATYEGSGFTQHDLAQIFNRDQTTISRWLKAEAVLQLEGN